VAAAAVRCWLGAGSTPLLLRGRPCAYRVGCAQRRARSIPRTFCWSLAHSGATHSHML